MPDSQPQQPIPDPSDMMRVGAIFFPEAFRRRMELTSGPGRLVHYTNTQAAINILRRREVWMRKPQWMADYTEIQHGFDCLLNMYDKGPGGQRFKAALEAVSPGMVERVTKDFDVWLPTYRANTYVTCVAAHDDDDDETGRMGMWTGFTGGSGVALVLKSAPFTAISDVLGAYSFPVSYHNVDQFDQGFTEIAQAVEASADFLRGIPASALDWFLHEVFRFHLVCTKRRAFRDEREWRIVYSPDRQPAGKAQLITQHVEFIGGEPQPVCKIPLEAHPGHDISIPAILDRVIIGPGKFRVAIAEAFRIELGKAGVPDPADRVFYADLPLR